MIPLPKTKETCINGILKAYKKQKLSNSKINNGVIDQIADGIQLYFDQVCIYNVY